ncbi:MAG: hypothetical protein KC549_13735 [Myxococcales bacterium]|nr:hypothetical protein [Myxococcales bacterium]
MSGFVFEGMTPALQAWVDYAGQAGADPQERDRLKGLVPPALLARWWAAQRVWRCRDEARVGEPVVHAAPSGRYRLEVTTHAEGPRTWAYAKGRVYDGETLVAEILRNFSHFPFVWVEGHASGHDYLIGGEDYQGQTVIELDTGRRAEHLPPEAAEGRGFCWADFALSPSGRTLAVEGCYWAWPYELRLVDLGDPLTALPVLTYFGDEASIRWLPDEPDAGDVTRRVELYAPTGGRADDLSDAEEADLQRRQAAGETDLWRTEARVERWVRGSIAAHAGVQIDAFPAGEALWAEGLRNVQALIDRAPPADQALLLARLAARASTPD